MTIHAIQTGAVRIRPTVNLPTHDPEAAERLSNRRLAGVRHHQTAASDWSE
jgi:hypothetical protein